MATPNQALIECKRCGKHGAPHMTRTLWCDPCAKAQQVAYQRTYRERTKASAGLVECKGCGKQFDASLRGRKWRCPECLLAYQREYAARKKERLAEHSRNYRERQGDAYRAKMRQRRDDLLAEMTPDQQAAFRRAEADKSARLNAELREQVFAAYGGYRCVCCGETERMFLTIDHVANDGAEMRQNGTHSRGGTQFYQWLRKRGFPVGFQVLCMNCNVGKHRNGGVCPHQSGKV